MKFLKNIVKKILIFLKMYNFIRVFRRKKFAYNYYKSQIFLLKKWAWKNNEDTNFYYKLTDHNLDILAHIISLVTNKTYNEIKSYFDELENDKFLKHHLQNELLKLNYGKDIIFNYGRRIGWYAISRALKPKIIIETGVNDGVGSCVLSKSLILNKIDGFPGKYFGTEIDQSMGKLLDGKYKEDSEILYGDSIKSLEKFKLKIDLFINDSDHSSDYEYLEYNTIANKLSDNAIILGDNSHSTDKLSVFSKENGRKFIFFKEQPLNHWYPGAGIGISFKT